MNYRLFLFMAGIFAVERLSQSLFLYQISIFPSLLLALALIGRSGNKFIIFAIGALISDIFLGLRFGLVLVSLLAVFISVRISENFFNFSDSITISVIAAGLFSLEYLALVFWLGKIDFVVFYRSLALVWAAAAALIIILRLSEQYFYGKSELGKI